MSLNNRTSIRVQSEFETALKKAFWRQIRQWLGRGCNSLLSFNDVFQFIKQQPHVDLGQKRVPLTQIVGSSGRFQDFDLAFNPRHRHTYERWVSVAQAKQNGKALPPIMLYKVGEAYFVEDGNHRVSVARAYGETEIAAHVIEIDPSNLTANPKCTRLGYQLPDVKDDSSG